MCFRWVKIQPCFPFPPFIGPNTNIFGWGRRHLITCLCMRTTSYSFVWRNRNYVCQQIFSFCECHHHWKDSALFTENRAKLTHRKSQLALSSDFSYWLFFILKMNVCVFIYFKIGPSESCSPFPQRKINFPKCSTILSTRNCKSQMNKFFLLALEMKCKLISIECEILGTEDELIRLMTIDTICIWKIFSEKCFYSMHVHQCMRDNF